MLVVANSTGRAFSFLMADGPKPVVVKVEPETVRVLRCKNCTSKITLTFNDSKEQRAIEISTGAKITVSWDDKLGRYQLAEVR
jgi:hypothetical protein